MTAKSNSLSLSKPLKITLRYHVVFWFLYFLLNTFRWGRYFNDYVYSLKTNLLGFPIHMILTYLNLLILMPKLLYRKKYVQYVFFLLLSIFIMVLVKFNLTYYLVSTNVWPEGPRIIHKFTIDYAIDMMIGELYVITFVTAIKITIDWIREHKRLTDLEKVQLETELLFLRTQISPHFFFNTLNNIYSLAIEKSNRTPQIILKLSELMRYLLYETKDKYQTLENEILCIQNYIDLEKIRYGNLLEVNIDITGDIKDKKIAPILLLSFVENAFKHGVNKNIVKTKIEIDFKITNNFLYFKISNPMPAKTTYIKKEISSTGGIGLNNVRKRLALGYKNEEYDLSFKTTKKVFIVELKIKVT